MAAASVLTVLLLLNRQAGLQASDRPAKRFVVTFNATFAGSIEEWSKPQRLRTALVHTLQYEGTLQDEGGGW